MSTTTGTDLLGRADRLTRQLRSSQVPVTRAQWETFDVTLRRVLFELCGPNAFRIPRCDPARAELETIGDTYPTPLRPTGHPTLSSAEAALVLKGTNDWVHRPVRHTTLHLVRDAGALGVGPDPRADITPSDPTDPHPLARLSVTLGALADLIQQDASTGRVLLPAPGEAAGAARQILTLGAVAARHALTHGAITDADRPLAVAQYAERAIDLLRDTARRPVDLDRLTAISPNRARGSANDRLEAAIHDWGAAGRFETTRLVPCVDVLRTFANQGAHMYAVTHQLLHTDRADTSAQEDVGRAAEALTCAARALRLADREWARLTTATRPTHEFVTASRDLFAALQDVTQMLKAEPAGLDAQRAVRDLALGAETLAELVTATQTLPSRLIKSNLLFAPAKTLKPTVDRLTSRRTGKLVAANAADLPDLPERWLSAVDAARDVTARVRPLTRQPLDTHPLGAGHSPGSARDLGAWPSPW